MVSAASALRMAARHCQQCRVAVRPTANVASPFVARAFSTTPFVRAEAEIDDRPESEKEEWEKEIPLERFKEEAEAEVAELQKNGQLTDEYIHEMAEETGAALRSEEFQDHVREFVGGIVPQDVRNRRTIEVPFEGKQKQGLFNMGEEPGMGSEDPEFQEDDITSLAHGQLEQHREYREYMRIAAWEMPLLTKLAKPFVPPTANQPLRFRYTTYMGESHPAEKKVVVEFCPADIPGLSAAQQLKLKKLAGVRYNPETEIIKMSCESFDTQAQNKRYLGDLVDSLVTEAKDPKDMFEDVPLDTRHHTFKVKPKFPKEWRITPERLDKLKMGRELAEMEDKKRAETGAMVDGRHIISIAADLAAAAAANAVTEVPVATKGKKVSVRR